MQALGLTDTGIKRIINEDSFRVQNYGETILAVLCDGMGGARGGSTASSTGVKVFIDTFTELFNKAAKNIFGKYDFKTMLFTAVAKANNFVFTKSVNEFDLHGMGTTIIACVAANNEYHAINVGDSRLYAIDAANVKLAQITKDHSFVQELIDSGKLTRDEAEKSPKRNLITRALGIDEAVDVDYYSGKFESGTLLLCSDGLYNFVKEEDIYRAGTVYDDLDNCAKALIDKANQNGGGDNITVVMIRH